jgi:hypothetical protein
MNGGRRQDVESIDAIVNALYDVISGPAGPRDWERDRFLFAPGARLQPTQAIEGGAPALEVLDIDAYVASRAPFFAANDFYEVEIARRVEQFGSIAHVWSTFESRHTPGGEPFTRGINSIQLFHDGDRWWVVSVLWDKENEGKSLPERYLGAEE